MLKLIAIEALALSVWGHQPDSTVLAGADEGTLEDLEIVAGHVWNAVGGADQGEVQVKQVDPKRFGIEIAAGTKVEWVTGEEGDTKDITLATLRPFKPMDMIVTEKTDDGAGTVAVVTGLTEIAGVEINGIQQFTSKNNVPSAVFGSVLSAPRPKLRFDTVQTAPFLTAEMVFVGGTIGASATASAQLTFGGVAVKR
jgi:hypothetical protein